MAGEVIVNGEGTFACMIIRRGVIAIYYIVRVNVTVTVSTC